MLRPLTHADADAVADLMDAAWGVRDRSWPIARARHLATTDPDGAWAIEDDGTVVGATLAIVREDLWGLSLLIVRADVQSQGHGRTLMAAATAYGSHCQAGIILSSEDARALRAYWRAGYTLRPCFDAGGPVTNRPRPASGVREARWPADRELVDTASRAARGAAHGQDIDFMLGHGRRLLVHDGGGFAVYFQERLMLLAATDDRVATELLETVLSDTEPSVEFLDAQQDWAIDLVLKAGMTLKPGGATCVRGAVGPMRPYIPSGAYL